MSKVSLTLSSLQEYWEVHVSWPRADCTTVVPIETILSGSSSTKQKKIQITQNVQRIHCTAGCILFEVEQAVQFHVC